jgi:hypothetical protein
MGTFSPIRRADGVTESERYLKRLCDHSFLSLWSYSGVYRDQGSGHRGNPGKELCDLLVVFENHVVIFSDKDCAFDDNSNLDLGWGRWYRKAILKSAEQVWGAERWLRRHPDRLFLDARCTQSFPIELPAGPNVKFHRIVVANGAAQTIRSRLGGSGSFPIINDLIGDDHCKARSEGGTPFAVGKVDAARGYIHILNEASLSILLRELDTASDFIRYLSKKEELVVDPRFGGAAGEEELLAAYLSEVDTNFEHVFDLPQGFDRIFFDVGFWENFAFSSERRSRIEADKVSYMWDDLIESFSTHILAGTQHFTTNSSIAESEKGVRFLAREPRMRRRMLAKSLRDRVLGAPPGPWRASRIMPPSKPGDPHYVFMTLGHPTNVSLAQYRETRRVMLEECCRAVKLQFPDALDVVGIATEPGNLDERSEDLVVYDARHFTEEDRRASAEFSREYQFMKKIRKGQGTEHEYPGPQPIERSMKGRARNMSCPCGSGKKLKRCCGLVASQTSV